MKKILLLTTCILLLIGLTLGLAGCKKGKEETEKSYSLDSSEFNGTAVFGENLSLNGLKLVESGGSVIAVTSDMVKGIDTSSVGAKQLTVSYKGHTFTVDYSVKYRITYVINDEETVQLVTDVSEIVVPETPTVVGKQFDSWSVSLPTVLTSNLRIDAIYRSLSSQRENAYTWTGVGLINLEGYVTFGDTPVYTVTDEAGNELFGIASFDGATNKLHYTLSDNTSVIITVSGEGVMQKSWRVEKTAAPRLAIAGGIEAVAIPLGSNRESQKINVSDTPIGFKYTVSADNANVNATAANGYLFIDVLKAGVTELSIVAVNATNELESVILTQYVVVSPGSFYIANDTTEYGIEDIWTVGRENAEALPHLTVSVTNADKIGAGFYENLSWVSGSSYLTVTDGAITLANTASSPEIVSIKAVFSYKGITVESAPMKVRCVYDGVNVYSYEELWTETNKADPRPIVLQRSIKEDFSSTNYNTIYSTYDLTYYENLYGKNTAEFNGKVKIKVLIQFKNDVYGNGYEINAHNATLGTHDATGKPTERSLFRSGPLDFVAMSQSGGAISFKGQDNIVFGVYENVLINNVILKSCEPTSSGGTIDLSDLEYAGTTVEVLGDNVAIEYARIMYGRTTLRVFGDAYDSEREIHVEVKNTLIKGAREFNARVGSNRFVYDEVEAAPLLPGDSGSDYLKKQSYNKMTDEQKAEYDDKYINTFLTFENVIFEDAGIFAVALDSHFAGLALQDGDAYVNGALIGWKDLAKTSYGAKITLKTDVRFYSWKALEDIDSGTILENTFDKAGNNLFSGIRFDVQAIVEKAAEQEKFSALIYNYGGKEYIHAGITFFCGGKNYSVVQNNITSAEFNHTFREYEVSLDDLEGQSYFKKAAGNEPFYFLIYDSTSSFTYADQLAKKDYSCLYN